MSVSKDKSWIHRVSCGLSAVSKFSLGLYNCKYGTEKKELKCIDILTNFAQCWWAYSQDNLQRSF